MVLGSNAAIFTEFALINGTCSWSDLSKIASRVMSRRLKRLPFTSIGITLSP